MTYSYNIHFKGEISPKRYTQKEALNVGDVLRFTNLGEHRVTDIDPGEYHDNVFVVRMTE